MLSYPKSCPEFVEFYNVRNNVILLWTEHFPTNAFAKIVVLMVN